MTVTLIANASSSFANIPDTYNGTYVFTATEVNGTMTDTAEVTATITVTREEVVTYTVTFNTNGGSVVNEQVIQSRGTVEKPADPTKEGFEFAGWFTDSEFKNEYNFATPVTSNFTLYAKWTVPPVEHKILDGDKQTFDTDSDEDLVIRAEGDIDTFVEVRVDKKLVNPSNYEVREGSTIVTLKASYLKTLKNGNHTLAIVFNDGQANATFKVANNNPETFDDIFVWVSLLAISITGLAIGLVSYKKTKQN